MESINDFLSFTELDNDYEDDFFLKEEINYENEKEISTVFIPKIEFHEMEMKYIKNEDQINSNSLEDKSNIIHFLNSFNLKNLNDTKFGELDNIKEKKEKIYIASKKRREEINDCSLNKEKSNHTRSFGQIFKIKISKGNFINDKDSLNESKSLKTIFSEEINNKNNIYFLPKKRDYINNFNKFQFMMDLDDDI